MSARTVILGLVREALAAIRTQHAVTAVTVLLLAASSFTVVTTAGRAAASQAAVLSTIDARGTRTILVQAKGAVEGVDEQFLATLARVADVEAATGFGPVTDVTAAANPDGPRLGVRQAYGVIGGRLLTQPEPGPAGVLLWTSPAASRVVGLPPGAGSVRAVDGGEYLISRSLEVPDYLSGFEPLAVIPATPREPGAAPRPVSTVVVLTRSPESVGVVTTLITRLLREAPPDQLTIQTSEGLAALRKAVGGEITRGSRGLILGVLGAAALTSALTVFGYTMLRRKDFGRRRALGATRMTIVLLIALQVMLTAAFAAALGVGVALAYQALRHQPVPPAGFSAAVAIAITALATLAAVLPATLTARRDPVRELRVP